MKIRVRKDKEDKGEFRGLLLSFLLFLAAAAAFGAGSLGFLNRTGQRSQETLRKAITRACIQCYAIEGRYPPSVEYLEENYGIQIDHDKYNVFYDGFASNIMPEITVIPVVEGPIGRHPTDRKKMAINHKNGKDAITHYKVLERFGEATYVECRLETGRTHQIRVHMASIGHPLLGDTVYGSSRNPYHLEGQALHAMILGFVHPRTGEYMEFTAPLPEYFVKLLTKLRK